MAVELVEILLHHFPGNSADSTKRKCVCLFLSLFLLCFIYWHLKITELVVIIDVLGLE